MKRKISNLFLNELPFMKELASHCRNTCHTLNGGQGTWLRLLNTPQGGDSKKNRGLLFVACPLRTHPPGIQKPSPAVSNAIAQPERSSLGPTIQIKSVQFWALPNCFIVSNLKWHITILIFFLLHFS